MTTIRIMMSLLSFIADRLSVVVCSAKVDLSNSELVCWLAAFGLVPKFVTGLLPPENTVK